MNDKIYVLYILFQIIIVCKNVWLREVFVNVCNLRFSVFWIAYLEFKAIYYRVIIFHFLIKFIFYRKLKKYVLLTKL